MSATINIATLIETYGRAPGKMPLRMVDGLCARLDLSKKLAADYDADFKKAASSEVVPPELLLAALEVLLGWEREHADWKVLNTLLKAVEKHGIPDGDFRERLRVQFEERACRD